MGKSEIISLKLITGGTVQRHSNDLSRKVSATYTYAKEVKTKAVLCGSACIQANLIHYYRHYKV